MQRVTTHDGKFDETSEEISLSNKWLNDVQHEIINVIEKEGLVLNKDKNDQLNEAIDKKILKLSINTNNNGNEFFVSKNVSNTIKVLKSDDLLKVSQETKTISREKNTGKWLSCSREINYNDAPDLNTFFNTSFDGLKDGSIPSKKHVEARYNNVVVKLISEIEELKNQIKTMLANNAELANAERDRKANELQSLKKGQEDLAEKQLKLEEDARKAEEARKAEDARKAEEARKAAEARKIEETNNAEAARRAEEDAEEARKAEEDAEEARRAEKLRQEEEEDARRAEKLRQEEEARWAEAANRLQAGRRSEEIRWVKEASERAEIEAAADATRAKDNRKAAELFKKGLKIRYE
ncbi:hypothetical protein [Silvanigrella sp.]|jgi:hypothetical protein|uniref:hypothetical protein n=1 Tax=Silvanigrella sp. TaxID=2024976 RepID=UPI0037C98DE1